MNYTQIKAMALAYSDRQDNEVIDNMDNFLRVVEARLNRKLRVRKMSMRTFLNTVTDQTYYGLPSDFAGLRDIQVKDTETSDGGITLQYLSPEGMNIVTEGGSTNTPGYTIIADQLQIHPAQEGKVLEIVYYQRLLPLSTTNPETWLATTNPDMYIFGIMVEISSFVKDAQAREIWDARFIEEVDSLAKEDERDRWSGTALQVRTG